LSQAGEESELIEVADRFAPVFVNASNQLLRAAHTTLQYLDAKLNSATLISAG
jgi:hypothetical protein